MLKRPKVPKESNQSINFVIEERKKGTNTMFIYMWLKRKILNFFKNGFSWIDVVENYCIKNML